MVSEKRVGDETVFLCDICGLGYADRKAAQNCEGYCRAHHGSSSAEIRASLKFCDCVPATTRLREIVAQVRAYTRLAKQGRCLQGSVAVCTQ